MTGLENWERISREFPAKRTISKEGNRKQIQVTSNRMKLVAGVYFQFVSNFPQLYYNLLFFAHGYGKHDPYYNGSLRGG